MYQFYYADPLRQEAWPEFQRDLREVFSVTALRPAMWEEHCLECSAPLCFQSCVHYAPRSDGRCKRFVQGIQVFEEPKACCGQGARIQFRKWANLMSIVFPDVLPVAEYEAMQRRNQTLGNGLKKLALSPLPQSLRWQGIRTVEYLRRRSLRKGTNHLGTPNAFVFHGYSHAHQPYRLMVEIYDDHTSVFKTALSMEPGENLYVLGESQLSPECVKPGNLVKLYPENDLEVTLDLLWCDFVQGTPVCQEAPAPTVKCVVWDLDNTLWDGTLIETEDPDALALKPHVLETIQALDQRGILQSVASKNDMDAAWPVVERLGLGEYFLYPQIHWNAKSGSVEQIAQALNIGLDTFALVDDSAFERHQVQSVWPQVRVLDPQELQELFRRPEFQVPVTQESRNRRAMYQAEAKRSQLRTGGSEDTVEFLRKCHLSLTVFEPETPEEQMRCYELTARTNQLNMSGRKYTPQEFQAVLHTPGVKNVAFSCQDDFGTYGIVGFAQYVTQGGRLTFREFAMSCRAAGKYVESAFFAAILKKENCTQGFFTVTKTKKNTLLRNTLEEIGFRSASGDAQTAAYSYTAQLKHWDLVQVQENIENIDR